MHHRSRHDVRGFYIDVGVNDFDHFSGANASYEAA